MKNKYTAYALDVWGNEFDGYEVNNLCKIGTIYLDPELTWKEWLESIHHQFLYGGTDHFEINDISDNDLIHVDIKESRKPILQLKRVENE